MSFPIFLDTCVLFGQAVCDLMLGLAEVGCFTPYWSSRVLDSMERAVVQSGRAQPEAVHQRRRAMERAFPDASVNGVESLVERMPCHPGDRHVLAACVVSPARTLVTFNVKDFPAAPLAAFDIAVVHPDDFLLDQFDLSPELALGAVTSLLARNRRPPRDTEALARLLRASGLPRTATRLGRTSL